ncbi:MAG: hypothetical protein ACREAK_00885 [Nitrosarchaeum sp.]
MKNTVLIGIGIGIFLITVTLIVLYQNQKAPYDHNEIQWCFRFIESQEYLKWEKGNDMNYEPEFIFDNYKIKLKKMNDIEPFCKKAIEYGSLMTR